MGIFSKLTTVCNICGSSIIGLNAQKIADGSICNNCKSKLSPHLKHCESMSAADICDHMRRREENRTELEYFQPTRILLAPRSDIDELYGTPVYIDEYNRRFLFSNNGDYLHENAEIFDFADFRSFSYSEGKIDKDGYISITLRVYSEDCRSIIEKTYEWSVELPLRYRRKPQDYPEYRSILTEVQNTEAYFNWMSSNSSEPAPSAVTAEEEETVNVTCPNCGAVTTLSGPSTTCEYCGLTITNEYYQEPEDESEDEVYDESYDGGYSTGYAGGDYGGIQSNGIGSGFSYSSNNIEMPAINIGRSNVGESFMPPTTSTPPPLQRGTKAGPPSLSSAIKRGTEKQLPVESVKDKAIQGAINQAGKPVMHTTVNHVGQKAGSYVMSQTSSKMGKSVAIKAGQQVGRNVAGAAGKQIVNSAGKVVAKQAMNTAGRAVAKQAVNTAGKAVARQAVNTAGKAVAKQAAKSASQAVAKSAGKAVVKQASKSVAKSVGKAAAKGALNGLRKLI